MNIIEWLKSIFIKAYAKFREFIGKVFTAASQVVIAQLKDFAIEVVKGLTVEDITNEEKREKAFGAIKNKALVKGIKIRDSLIYLLIEMALQYIRNEVEE